MRKLIVTIILVGGLAGFVQKDLLLNRTNIYNEKGIKTGFVKKNPVLNRYDIFDKSGKYDGYLKYNQLMNRFEHHKEREN